jgi:hypothetical protein
LRSLLSTYPKSAWGSSTKSPWGNRTCCKLCWKNHRGLDSIRRPQPSRWFSISRCKYSSWGAKWNIPRVVQCFSQL